MYGPFICTEVILKKTQLLLVLFDIENRFISCMIVYLIAIKMMGLLWYFLQSGLDHYFFCKWLCFAWFPVHFRVSWWTGSDGLRNVSIKRSVMLKSSRLCPLVWSWLAACLPASGGTDSGKAPLCFPWVVRPRCILFLNPIWLSRVVCGEIMQQSAVGPWMNSSSRKDNMSLSIRHNTTQRLIIPLLPAFFLFFFFFCVPPPLFQSIYLVARMPKEPVAAAFLGPGWVIANWSAFTQPAPSWHALRCLQYNRAETEAEVYTLHREAFSFVSLGGGVKSEKCLETSQNFRKTHH